MSLDDFYIIEKIMLLLDTKGRFAMSATCQRWREVGMTSDRLLHTVSTDTKDGTTPLWLNTEEKLDSFEYWLSPRGHLVKHLTMHYIQSVLHSDLAAAALESVAGSLETFSLVLGRSTRNRRGLPAEVTLTWLPRFEALKTFNLRANWFLDTNWQLSQTMPALENLELSGRDLKMDMRQDIDVLPRSLKSFKALDYVQGLEAAIKEMSKLPELRELGIGWSEPEELAEMEYTYHTLDLCDGLGMMTGLTSLIFDERALQLPADYPMTLYYVLISRLQNLQHVDLTLELARFEGFLFNSLDMRASFTLQCMTKIKRLTSLKLHSEKFPPHVFLATDLDALTKLDVSECLNITGINYHSKSLEELTMLLCSDTFLETLANAASQNTTLLYLPKLKSLTFKEQRNANNGPFDSRLWAAVIPTVLQSRAKNLGGLESVQLVLENSSEFTKSLNIQALSVEGAQVDVDAREDTTVVDILLPPL